MRGSYFNPLQLEITLIMRKRWCDNPDIVANDEILTLLKQSKMLMVMVSHFESWEYGRLHSRFHQDKWGLSNTRSTINGYYSVAFLHYCIPESMSTLSIIFDGSIRNASPLKITVTEQFETQTSHRVTDPVTGIRNSDENLKSGPTKLVPINTLNRLPCTHRTYTENVVFSS